MSAYVKTKAIPQNTGVYIFKNKRGTPIYIGKAANLRARLKSYKTSQTHKTNRMIKEACDLSWEVLGSETEALIREAELIKQHHPKYNILMRDDKQYLHVGFTNEHSPKIFVTHQPQAPSTFIGPFTDSGALRITLKSLRRIFPYCTCLHPHKTLCLNARIGSCLGYCCFAKPLNSSSRELAGSYTKNISAIKKILSGKNKSLLRELKKQMRAYSHVKRYEEAVRVRDQIRALERVFAHRPVLRQDIPTERAKALSQLAMLFDCGSTIRRIEGYDISNIHGKYAYGSMVVFIDGLPQKNEYRIFKIKTIVGSDDPSMIKEVISRRFNHPEWPYPDAILIDGGKAQLNAAMVAQKHRALGKHRAKKNCT